MVSLDMEASRRMGTFLPGQVMTTHFEGSPGVGRSVGPIVCVYGCVDMSICMSTV